MNESSFYHTVLLAFFIIGGGVFVLLFFITAPYGRHRRKGWGLEIDNRIAWIVMEAVSLLGFWFFFLIGDWKSGIFPLVFLALWTVHYFYRSFVFPSLFRSTKQMPILVMLMAVIFNICNSYIQGRYLFHFADFSEKYGSDWLLSPQFIFGVLLFLGGFLGHVHSDSITRRLRDYGENDYKIPRGGLFRWVSNPNYLSEIIQWCGWALLTWSAAGLAFAFWTTANLLPRAFWNHKWYVNNFDNYPDERRAIIPYIF